ncbi:fimbrial protein [Burkholderia cepacia]|uniref:fimbrial protein n=1 Tax=Burkholderia cepacia TaxID=292 RepID=UPI003529638E
MTVKNTLALAAFAIATASGTAAAQSNGQINFSGNITEAPCSIDGDNVNQTVELGSISTNIFNGVGSQSTAKDFQINLTGCNTATLKTAQITFSGTPDGTNPDLLKVGSGMPGAAQNVAVGLYDVYNNKTLALNAESDAIPLQSGLSVLPFRAYYQQTAANVAAGSANASAQFTISYN